MTLHFRMKLSYACSINTKDAYGVNNSCTITASQILKWTGVECQNGK